MATETYRTRLQQILREEGRYQSWLSQRAGIDEAHVSRIVNGLQASDATKRSIAAALGRTVEDVFPNESVAA